MVIEQKFKEGEEPDPTPYLFISLEMKRADQTKPYDAKTACWVPDDKECFVIGAITGTKGEQVTVKLPSGDVRIVALNCFEFSMKITLNLAKKMQI